jgi:hypothetical protein
VQPMVIAIINKIRAEEIDEAEASPKKVMSCHVSCHLLSCPIMCFHVLSYADTIM